MEVATVLVPALSFGAVASAAYALVRGRSDPNRLAARIERATVRDSAPGPTAEPASEVDFQLLRAQKYSNWALLDQMIARRSWAEREAAELTRANVPLRVGEYLLLRALLGLVLFTLAWLVTGNVWVAAPLVPLGWISPRLWITNLQQKRRIQFENQLVDALQLLASTLKSGYSFLQGMEAISREMDAPIAEEFDLLVKEIGVGARADEALLRLVDRVRSPDLELAVTAIMIQRTVGGELAGILDTIAQTIRERQKIMRDVSTLTAQQRWSGYIIGALPLVVMAAIGFINPGYVGELLFTVHGRIMLGVAGVMELIGFVMIRQIVAIDV